MVAATEKNLYQKLIFFAFLISLFSIAIFLPIKIRYANLSVAAAAFFWLLQWKQNLRAITPELKFPIILFCSLYFIHILGIIHTHNLLEGWFILEKKTPMLALPVIVIGSFLNAKEIRTLFITFVFSVSFACLYCYYNEYLIMAKEGLPLSSFVTQERFQNVNFTQYLPIHPAYLSNCIIIAFVFTATQFRDLDLIARMGLIFLWLFFLTTIVVLMARGSLVALVMVAIIYFVYQTWVKRNFVYLISGALVVIVIGLLVVQFVPNVKLRVQEIFSGYETMVNDGDEYHSVPLHVKSWHCAIQSTLNINMFFGHGTGDEVRVMKACYRDNGWLQMEKMAYDSHNEYLSAFVRHGLVGLAVWLGCLFYGMYYALKKNSILYLSFIVLMALAAFSESILRGQVPLLTYSFFNAAIYKLISLEGRHSHTESNDLDSNKHRQ